MEEKLWYAVIGSDYEEYGCDMSYGSFDRDEAIKMMMEDEEYSLIAVIENGNFCIDEIRRSDVATYAAN